jgi:hypothetical protein
MKIRTIAHLLILPGLLAGCSHKETQHQTASAISTPKPAVVPVAPAVSQMTPKKMASAFVQKFGQGTLAVMKSLPGPAGLTAVLVAPAGTKVVTPQTPAAVLWVLPGGQYAIQGTLLNRAGDNLTRSFSAKMGLIQPVISMPPAPTVAPTASATSTVPVSTKNLPQDKATTFGSNKSVQKP